MSDPMTHPTPDPLRLIVNPSPDSLAAPSAKHLGLRPASGTPETHRVVWYEQGSGFETLCGQTFVRTASRRYTSASGSWVRGENLFWLAKHQLTPYASCAKCSDMASWRRERPALLS